ncbi:MAG: hypothetical protein IPH04_01715 [Saprospirales bacterium]|nr:hypothetical protein [Saprospirales bacterium]
MKFLLETVIFFVIAGVTWASCQKGKEKNPLGLAIHGPFDVSIYLDTKNQFKLKRPIDLTTKGNFDGGDVFYLIDVSNHSNEPVLVSKSNYGENFIWCHYFCFWYNEDRYLVPGQGVLGVDDITAWDTLFANTTKQYVTWFDFEILGQCDIINLSINVKSPFFDSLNVNNPVRYFWDSATPIELRHPVYFFNVKDERFFPALPFNIQKELEKSKKKFGITG